MPIPARTLLLALSGWLVLGVVAASLVLYGVERFVGWPEALQVNPPPKP